MQEDGQLQASRERVRKEVKLGGSEIGTSLNYPSGAGKALP